MEVYVERKHSIENVCAIFAKYNGKRMTCTLWTEKNVLSKKLETRRISSRQVSKLRKILLSWRIDK